MVFMAKVWYGEGNWAMFCCLMNDYIYQVRMCINIIETIIYMAVYDKCNLKYLSW